jgi:hypothetical protein
LWHRIEQSKATVKSPAHRSEPPWIHALLLSRLYQMIHETDFSLHLPAEV